MAIKKFRISCILPRTKQTIEICVTESLEKAMEYCEKNKKFYPILIIEGGTKRKITEDGEYFQHIIENEDYVDSNREYLAFFKIGKLKKRPKFSHTILKEDETKFMFLVKYKRDQVRICTADIGMKKKIEKYLKSDTDCWRIKIYHKALPLVYYRVNGREHMTLMELVTGKKPSGYMIFKDTNPYNYMAENIIRTKVSCVRTYKKKSATNYAGVMLSCDNVKKRPKYFCGLHYEGKRITIGRFHDEVLAAKAYDKKSMELYGRAGAKNFSYEYYAAFEPKYIENVK